MVTPLASHSALVRRAQLGLGVGELGAVVDAVGLVGVVGHHAHDPVAGLGQHLHDVGEVVLALGVVGLHHAQRRRQQAAAEAEDARVDLVDLELVGGGVAVLDDAGDAVVLAHAHDAAVAGGVVEPGGEDGARGAGVAVLGHQLGDRAGPAAAACRRGARARRMSSSRSSSGRPVRPTARASPVPRCTCCSTNSRRSPALSSVSFLVTRSAPWPTTTTARSISGAGSASSTYSTIARPQSRCSGFGRADRIREPSPAASTTADRFRPVMPTGLPRQPPTHARLARVCARVTGTGRSRRRPRRRRRRRRPRRRSGRRCRRRSRVSIVDDLAVVELDADRRDAVGRRGRTRRSGRR